MLVNPILLAWDAYSCQLFLLAAIDQVRAATTPGPIKKIIFKNVNVNYYEKFHMNSYAYA